MMNERLTIGRLDLVGRTVTNSQPRVSIPRGLDVHRNQVGTPELEQFLSSLETGCPEMTWMATIFRKMQLISNIINAKDNSKEFWEDEIGAIRLIGPVTHNILSMNNGSCIKTHNQSDQAVEDLATLAFLMLLSGLKKEFSLNASDMPLLQAQFAQKSASVACLSADDGPIGRLHIWALITGASLHPMSAKEVLIPQIFLLMKTLGLPNAVAVFNNVKELVWINALQSSEARNLANEIENYTTTSLPPFWIHEERKDWNICMTTDNFRSSPTSL
ncbi:hypothetical protein BGZ63DRAFT_202151 [Mariannaea sp. PMI_226]|nr:hypothetical protein BGZ63DRAFT_202151 [Mariannaea sp. PMI_226]